MAEANVEALRRGYEALNRGDLSVVLELIDHDIRWHEPSPSPDAGTHTGRDSFDGFNVEPEQVFERDDRLIAVVHQSGVRQLGIRRALLLAVDYLRRRRRA